jgi:hypothetical protein
MRNLQVAHNADNVSNIPLGKLNLKFKKWWQVLKFCLASAVFIPKKACPTYHFQASLIWCNGTFKALTYTAEKRKCLTLTV